jgi:hypothetical protein
MPLPPLHSCHYCQAELSPKGHSVLRLVTGWVTGPTGKTVKDQVQEHYKYCHETCLPRKVEDATPPMF